MKRLVPVLAVFALAAIACGKETSIVPVISTLASPTPQPTAEVTFAPVTTPTPTTAPVVTPSPTPAPVPTATAAPVATTTPAASGFPTHTPTPSGQPPDAYMRKQPSTELKGMITYYDWPNSSGKQVAYTNQSADPTSSIAVKKGTSLQIYFTHDGKPDSNIGADYRTAPSRQSHQTPIPITDDNPATIQANFPSGTIWVDVYTYWGPNEVDYAFKLDVS